LNVETGALFGGRMAVIRGLFDQFADMAWWCAAVVIGAAPRRMWHRLEPSLPLLATAVPAGILTLLLGFVIGVPGFFAFAERLAFANNDWMLRQLALPAGPGDAAVGMVPYGVSVATLFIFLFFTPTGLVSVYLVASGTLRAMAAYADREDARGDFLLSGIHWAVTTAFARNREERRRLARARLEGAEAPDMLQTGQWAGLDADYVVLASRRKPEWDPGAIILTSTDWYRLGAAVDIQTPAGLRTAYPLTRMETVEVVRRGIQYELPRLSRQSTRKPQHTQS
jgi:hypothetical protein